MALTPEQYEAIAYLVQPKKGRLNYKQIAERVGVDERTLLRWRKKPDFDAEYKAEIVRLTHARLPELMDALADHAINDGNAAMAKLILEANRMLTKQVDVVSTETKVIDTGELQRRLDAIAGKTPDSE